MIAQGIPAWEFYGQKPIISLIRRFIEKVRLRAEWSVFKRSASAIITVSRYAKNILVKHLKFDERKVFVIYHGVDSDIFNPHGERVMLKRPYFLHVSQYIPSYHNRKNLKRMLASYMQLALDPKPYLVLMIPGYPEKIRIDGVILIRKAVNMKTLAKLYRGALAPLYPSLHESFGMPVLEAMASGCPVITSSVTALPEVAGDAAFLVNPYSIKEISCRMKLLAEDKDLRMKLSARGLTRARMFTWRKSAVKHKIVFENVLRARRREDLDGDALV